MKKTLVALAALAATAAFAQSSVTISGKVDVGFHYDSSRPVDKLHIDNGDNSRIIFSVVEDLGGGMAATAVAQMRFTADTGYQEGGTVLAANAAVVNPRPLFQGETRVGLRGGFGHVRLGRGLTAVQAPNGAYDPFGVRTVGALQGLLTAGYNSDPLQAGGSGAGRWSNAFFYDTPNLGGFSAAASFQMREAQVGYVKNGTSLSGSYNNGPLSLFAGFETNSVDTKYTQIAGSYTTGFGKLMASWAVQNPVGAANNFTGTGFGINVPMGAAVIKAGYARNNPQAAGVATGTKLAIGMDYALSKRTMIYTNVARNKTAAAAPVTSTLFDLGLQHNF